MFQIHHSDCLTILTTMPDDSVDAIITDPPYGISFMGKKWDYDVPSVEVWQECLRVLKPGGHILVACGTRTQHRMAVNIEDAGFEIRDTVAWIYGSGFPKSLDVSKAIDKQGGQSLDWFIDYILEVASERGIPRKELTMIFPSKNGNPTGWLWNKQKTQGITVKQFNTIKDFLHLPFENIEEAEREVIGRRNAGLTKGTIANFAGETTFDITVPKSDAAKRWEGWGTALKPAMELWTLARKPFKGTVAENVLQHGTGAINIDECRVPYTGKTDPRTFGGAWKTDKAAQNVYEGGYEGVPQTVSEQGRFPANVIHDGSDVIEPLGASARFFYCAKASKHDRNEGLDGATNKGPNHHPTVKPTELMRYLCRLITPPQGTVLDPFMGSGSTGKACALEGFGFIGIEREEEYVKIAQARIDFVTRQDVLFTS